MALRRWQVLAPLIALSFGGPAFAQRKPPVRSSDAPGGDVLFNKCFQCHSAGMWTDQRQERRAWESTLYRMVGRGALWTQDEIRQMADYLAAVYGRKAQ